MNSIEDSLKNNLDLPDKYIYKETSDGFTFEGEIPSGDFGNSRIANIFFIIGFIFFAILITPIFLQKILNIKIAINENIFLLIVPILFLVCLATGIILNSFNPSNKCKKMSVNTEGIVVDFKTLKNGKQKESIKISKNDILNVEVIKIRHINKGGRYTSPYNYNTYDIYLIGKNKIFIEKNIYLSKVFIGLSFKSEDTAIKIQQKFKNIWQIS